MQVAEAVPNPLHVIQHTEFILVREGELEFQHQFAAGKIVSERVGPGGVFYVALRHQPHGEERGRRSGALYFWSHRGRREVGANV